MVTELQAKAAAFDWLIEEMGREIDRLHAAHEQDLADGGSAYGTTYLVRAADLELLVSRAKAFRRGYRGV